MMKLMLAILMVGAIQQGRPPGWDRGNKTGWDGDVPPGWAQKSARDREAFTVDYTRARAELRLYLTNNKRSKISADVGCALFLRSVNAGLEISVALDLCKTSADHGLSEADCGIALRACSKAHGSGIKHGELGAFVKSRIKSGVRGNALAISIDGELARRKLKVKGPSVGKPGGGLSPGKSPGNRSSSVEKSKGKGKGKGKKR